MTARIHPTAVIAKGAELGRDVTIGPYSVIGAHVKIGEGTVIGPQVVIDGVTSIGRENRFLGQANIGGAPQDLSYEDEPTELEIGDKNTVREFVTINRGTIKGGGVTRVGNGCLFMACSHVAHDCEIGDGVQLGNSVLLAGHVAVGKNAIVNGAAAAHQFVTIGRNAYVGGLTRVIQDVPPFMILEGHPARVRKVNVIGLERAGLPPEEIHEVRLAFRYLFRADETRAHALARMEQELRGELARELLQSLRNTELGLKGRFRETLRADFRRRGEELMLRAAGAS
ncbi:MAG: acyl-ACP--UDP-N-acetylglucosamine O-acyltransferase [Planctomycetes bacterium]|nr:acyl-ACP--UDP-N-acetylglucosamine O-acyltransferase [Planctomycetota bacterium]